MKVGCIHFYDISLSSFTKREKKLENMSTFFGQVHRMYIFSFEKNVQKIIWKHFIFSTQYYIFRTH
jgi:hypothetical protein